MRRDPDWVFTDDRAFPQRSADRAQASTVIRAPVHRACAGAAPSCATSLSRPQCAKKRPAVTGPSCDGFHRHRFDRRYAAEVPAPFRHGRQRMLHGDPGQSFLPPFSFPSPSPRPGYVGGPFPELCDLTCSEIRPLALTQQSHEIDRRIRSEIGSHDAITAALALSSAGDSNLAHPSGAADFISLPWIRGDRIDDTPAFRFGQACRFRVTNKLRQFSDGVKLFRHGAIYAVGVLRQ